MDEITFDKLPMAVAAIDRKVNGLIERIDTLFGKDSEDKGTKHELLDLKAAAKFIGKATSTLYSMTSTRQIPFHKRGNKLYFFKDELTSWIETAEASGCDSSAENFADHLMEMQSSKRRKPKSGFQ